jgi:ABC-type polysaccharide/polyol phosphate export permease
MNAGAALALRDIVSGAQSWKSWGALALDDLEGRYRRTVLGPLWVTIAHGFFVAGFALWSSAILKQPLAQAFLYVAAGMTVWAFISGSLVEAPTIFIRAANFINAYELPISLQIFRAVSGQVLTFAHNMVVYLIALVVVRDLPGIELLLFIPGLLVVICAAVSWSVGLAVIGARYRDVGPLIGSVIGMLIILTPIFWRKTDIAGAAWIADINPIYHLIEIIRGPLMGYAPTALNWTASLIVVAISAISSIILLAINRKKISYWL